MPLDNTAALPVKQQFSSTVWDTGSPGWKVNPLVVVNTLLSNNKLSPAENISLSSPPVFKYEMNRTYQFPESGLPIYDFTLAFTPDWLPITTLPTKFLKYVATSIPSLDCCILTEVYAPLYLIPPPVTEDPSLKICCPNFSIWFWRTDWIPVNSLACTGNPGLNNILQ